MERIGFWKELLRNASATYNLQPRYYWLTTAVGLLATGLAIAIMFGLGSVYSALLGISAAEPLREAPNGVLWALLFFGSMPLAFYAAMVVVAYGCASAMASVGLMKREEVKFYALRSRYPSKWFRS